MTRIRLIRKLAAVLNGIDVSALRVGDTIELPDATAQMMIAERWAELASKPFSQGSFHPHRLSVRIPSNKI